MLRVALAAVLALAPLGAFASVGKVVKLDGAATRTGSDGKKEPLKLDAAIELKDTIDVGAKGLLKLELTDGSVIALDEKSRLEITEADFKGQDVSAFSATLSAGKLWTKVKKLLGDSKFEVKTPRAVAGVRGTIFRIDADALIKGAKGRKADVVRVVEGVVRVNPSAEVASKSKAAKPAANAKGPRTQVAGPTEVTADEWEKKFVELQQNSQIAVGLDLWEQAELDKAAMSDRFQKWVDEQK
jgi:hypothetical protein